MLENDLAATLSLNGEWEFSLDNHTGTIDVPGTWETQGYARDAVGPAVYRRTVDLPHDWHTAQVMLRFGAVSYYIEAFINGQLVGTHEGLWTAFEFDVTDVVKPGERNTIELHITKPGGDDSRFPYHETLTGFIPYIALTFGGIWQDVALVAHKAPAWDDVQVQADYETGAVAIQARVNQVEDDVTAHIRIIAPDGKTTYQNEFSRISNSINVQVTIENPVLWSPYHDAPQLYQAQFQFENKGKIISQTSRRFGFRKLHNNGEQLLLNGQSVHLRGILSWGWNPNTLAPMFTDTEIRDEFRRVRELGFNLIKLCLFVPPPNLLQIADEEGMLLWLELPLWLPRMTPQFRQQIVREYADILAQVQQHPSLTLYSLGCELGADMADATLLEQLNTLTRDSVHDVLVCDNSGSGEAYHGLTFDFADFSDYHFYCDLHYFNSLVNHFHRDWLNPRPWIFGEFCDSDDFRDMDELSVNGERPAWCDFMGVHGILERWAYSVQEERFTALNLPFSQQQVMAIARQESLLTRKFIVERVRLQSHIGGYVITGLRDTPVTTSGVFDDLNRAKFPAEVFRQFNADTVLLLEQGRTRTWIHGGDCPTPYDMFNHRAGDNLNLRIVIATSHETHAGGPLRWTLQSMTRDVPDITGTTSIDTPLVSGTIRELARINVLVPPVPSPQQWTLHVQLGDTLTNTWKLWFYPPAPAWSDSLMLYDPHGILQGIDAVPFDVQKDKLLIATQFTQEVQHFVEAGGRAIVLPRPYDRLPTAHVPFWRESIKLLYDHPALGQLPHEGYADMQFFHLATDYALNTEALQAQFPALKSTSPVMRRLDARLFTVLDYIADIHMGDGRMMVSTLNFAGGAGEQVVGFSRNIAAQHLLQQMIHILEQNP